MTQSIQPPGAGITVLIADDTSHILTVLSTVMESRGYNVVTAESGTRALELAARLRPQVAMLDVLMPGIDGLDLAARIKKSPELADTIVVLLTAITQGSDIPDGLWRVGTCADDFITKPFDPFDVADRVERLCAARNVAPRGAGQSAG